MKRGIRLRVRVEKVLAMFHLKRGKSYESPNLTAYYGDDYPLPPYNGVFK